MTGREHRQDVFDIREVVDRYADALDRRDWEALGSCFTAGCACDYGRFGRWADRESFVASLEEMHRDVGKTMHRLTNHRVEVDGDTARATTYLDALLEVEHRGYDLLHVVGTYEDELVRTVDGWLIASRRVGEFLRRRESAKS